MTVRGKHTSKQQKELLVELMFINRDLANDRFSSIDGRKHNKNLWEEFSIKLNAVGGSQKDGEKWKKTWVDMKKYVRTTCAKQKEMLNRTGLGLESKSIPRLDNLDEKILDIITTHSVDGDGETNEGGLLLQIPTEKENSTPVQTPTHCGASRNYKYSKPLPIIRGSARSRDKILLDSNKIELAKVEALNRIAAAMEKRNEIKERNLKEQSTSRFEVEEEQLFSEEYLIE